MRTVSPISTPVKTDASRGSSSSKLLPIIIESVSPGSRKTPLVISEAIPVVAFSAVGLIPKSRADAMFDRSFFLVLSYS